MRRTLLSSLAAGLMLRAAGVAAQSAPPPPRLPPPPGGATAPQSLPSGTGAGVFGGDSLFKPLAQRDDVVPWSILTQVTTRTAGKRVLPGFTPAQDVLDRKMQRIQGYMMPLEPGERQTHFLLTSVPLTCPFCVPGGPESMVEVRTRSPVRYAMEPVVVEGRFSVLRDDASGLYYRMLDAVAVK